MEPQESHSNGAHKNLTEFKNENDSENEDENGYEDEDEDEMDDEDELDDEDEDEDEINRAFALAFPQKAARLENEEKDDQEMLSEDENGDENEDENEDEEDEDNDSKGVQQPQFEDKIYTPQVKQDLDDKDSNEDDFDDPTQPRKCPTCLVFIFGGVERFKTHMKTAHPMPRFPIFQPKTQPESDMGFASELPPIKQEFLVPLIKLEDDPDAEIETKFRPQKGEKSNFVAHCIFCGKKFCRPYSLKRHIETVHEGQKKEKGEQIPCDFCGKTYTKRSLRWHMKKEHGEILSKRHKCEICKKSFNKIRLLELHKKYYHEQGNIDGKGGKNPENQKGLKLFFCHLCDKSYTKVYHLDDHMKKSHGDVDINVQGGLQKFSCKPCGKTFDQRIELALHIKNTHEGQKNYKCRICEKSYSTHQYLVQHNDTVHLGLQNFACGKCDKICTDVEDLKHHIATLHDDSIFTACDICDKKFDNKYNLTAHIKKIHNKYPCQFCGKKFNDSFLKTHIITVHTDDSLKPFKCSICPKGFAQQNKLQVHMNIHAGIKPFTCQYCPRSFADQGNMRMHERVVHEGYKRSDSKNAQNGVKNVVQKPQQQHQEKPKEVQLKEVVLREDQLREVQLREVQLKEVQLKDRYNPPEIRMNEHTQHFFQNFAIGQPTMVGQPAPIWERQQLNQ